MIRHGTSWDIHETDDKTFSAKLTFVFVALCTYNDDVVGGVVMMMMVKMMTIWCG